jgi:hypothetical protein
LVSGLRVADVNFLRGVVHPAQQWPDKPLKTGGSAQPIPIPQDLALLLSASVQKCPSDMMVSNGAETDRCGPWIIERAIRDHVHRAPAPVEVPAMISTVVLATLVFRTQEPSSRPRSVFCCPRW